MANIQVLGGSLETGNWRVEFAYQSAYMSRGTKSINLGAWMIELIPLTGRNTKSILRSTGWGLVGGALIGPIGALAGTLKGGNDVEITFSCVLEDGNEFVGVTDSASFGRLQGALGARRSRQSSSVHTQQTTATAAPRPGAIPSRPSCAQCKSEYDPDAYRCPTCGAKIYD